MEIGALPHVLFNGRPKRPTQGDERIGATNAGMRDTPLNSEVQAEPPWVAKTPRERSSIGPEVIRILVRDRLRKRRREHREPSRLIHNVVAASPERKNELFIENTANDSARGSRTN